MAHKRDELPRPVRADPTPARANDGSLATKEMLPLSLSIVSTLLAQIVVRLKLLGFVQAISDTWRGQNPTA